jgi:putative flippase GtrA
MTIEKKTFKRDMLAALLVGLIAGPLSLIVLNNLGLMAKYNLSWWMPIVAFPILTVVGILVARLAGKFIPVIYKFGKFGEVGGLNFLVDLGVLNLLIWITGQSTGLYYSVFKGVSFVAAVANSYFWNKLWVFDDAKKQDQKKEAGKFIVASLLGLAFNVALASAIVFFGPRFVTSIDSKTWASIGSVVGSISAILFNFVLYKIWVFKD